MGKITRRMGTTSFVGIFASLMILTFAADARAQHGGCMMMGPCVMCGKGPGMMPVKEGPGHGAKHPSSASLMRMLHQWAQDLFAQSDQLGLNEEQIDEIESILMSHIKYATRKKADLKVLFLEIQELLLKDKINLKEVQQKLQAMEALNTDMAMEGVETLTKALAVLTPEQQKKIRRSFKKSTFMRTMSLGTMPGGMMGPCMMQGMVGQGGTPGEGKTKPAHEH
jgi:hypothetical protein